MKIIKKVDLSPFEMDNLEGIYLMWQDYIQKCNENHCDTCAFWGFCNLSPNLPNNFNGFYDKFCENLLERV